MKKLFWVVASYLFFCFSVWANETQSTRLSTREKFLESIQARFGQIVSEKNWPATHGALADIFDKLSAAQESMVGDKIVNINNFYILDSNEFSAFVLNQKEVGSKKAINHVFVTRGLLELFLKNFGEDAAGIEKTMKAVAGVLAHELAHPLEYYDEEGVRMDHKHALGEMLARKSASQAMELRADTEAIDILRRSGFSEDSLLVALEVFAKNPERHKPNINDLKKATHHDIDFRLSHQRMMLTESAHAKGRIVPSQKPSASTDILEELRLARGEWKFLAPKSVAELLERLDGVSSLKRSDDYKSVEFTRLILTLAETLDKTPVEKFSKEESSRIRKFLFSLWNPSDTMEYLHPQILNKWSLEYRIGRLDGAGFWSSKKELTNVVQSSEFFRTPEHKEWLKTAWNDLFQELEKKNPVQDRIAHVLTRWMYWMTQEEFRAQYSPLLKARILKNPHDMALIKNTITARQNGRILLDLDNSTHIQFSHWLMKEVFPNLEFLDQVRFFQRGVYQSGFWGTFQESPEAWDKGSPYYLPPGHSFKFEGLGSRRKSLSRNSKDWNLLKEMAASLWEQRAWIALHDTYSPVQWHYVFELLGIEEELGYAELRKSLKAYTQSKEFYEYLLEAKKAKDAGYLAHLDSIYPRAAPAWVGEDFIPYFGADNNKFVSESVHAAELKQMANQMFRVRLVLRNPHYVLNVYEAEIKKSLKDKTELSLKGLEQIHLAILNKISRGDLRDFPTQNVLLYWQLKALFESKISLDQKKSLARALALDHNKGSGGALSFQDSSRGAWLDHSVHISKRVQKILQENGVVSDIIDTFDILMTAPPFYLQRHDSVNPYILNHDKVFAPLAELNDLVLEAFEARLKSTQNPQELLEKMLGLVDPGLGKNQSFPGHPPRHGNSLGVRKIKARIAQEYLKQRLSKDQAIRVFERLSATGSDPSIDRFFEKQLAHHFSGALSESEQVFLHKALRSGKFFSADLANNLAEKVMASSQEEGLLQAKKREVLRFVDEAVEKIRDLFPGEKGFRDQALEKLAWKVDLDTKELNALIEGEKIINLRKLSADLVNEASAAVGLLKWLDINPRLDLMHYIKAGGDSPFPPRVRTYIEQALYNTFLEVQKTNPGFARFELGFFRTLAAEEAHNVVLQIEKLAREGSLNQKIPFYEVLIAAGPQALFKQKDFPDNVVSEFLKYPSQSVEEMMLLSYFDSVPKYEIPSTLAYLIAHSNERRGELKDIFYVFKSVGIKIGQMSSVFEIFGPERSRELEGLLDDAPQMSLVEIREALESQLSSEELAKIKSYKKILGSASIKNVVLLELHDGRSVVALVQRPHALTQIKSNSALSQVFLDNLQKRIEASGLDIKLPVGGLKMLMNGLQEQISVELDFTKEEQNIRRFKEVYEKQAQGLASLREMGFQVKVPSPAEGFQVRPQLMFLELGAGESWRKTSGALREASGRVIVELALKGLFEEGIFDADRHGGQTLVDESGRVIWSLDFGQGVFFKKSKWPWSADERTLVAEFLLGFSERNFDKVASSLTKMQTNKKFSKESVSKIAQEVFERDSNQSTSDFIRTLTNELSDRGFSFETKFSLGVFKGLLILREQGYVSPEEFDLLLEKNVRNLYYKKAPYVLFETVKGGRASCASALKGLLGF